MLRNIRTIKNKKEEYEQLKNDIKNEKDSDMKDMMLEEIDNIENSLPLLEMN